MMNWLAHAFLSEPDTEFRLGNLLADLVKGKDRARMSEAFLRGVKRHQAIDSFTDGHPAVHRSRARIEGDYPHVRGVLVDVFYDHFLALDWDRYSAEPLEAFTASLYADIQSRPTALPEQLRPAVEAMIAEDWLGSYRHPAGIETALRRVSARLSARVGRDFALEKAMSELLAHFDGLRADFAEFFPQLQTHAGRLSEAT